MDVDAAAALRVVRAAEAGDVHHAALVDVHHAGCGDTGRARGSGWCRLDPSGSPPSLRGGRRPACPARVSSEGLASPTSRLPTPDTLGPHGQRRRKVSVLPEGWGTRDTRNGSEARVTNSSDTGLSNIVREGAGVVVLANLRAQWRRVPAQSCQDFPIFQA